MKAVEEPACLSVGTDVSAKYRGAFCEAKIKTVKRLVKVKVTLKAQGTSQVVQDDQVKGPLRVGSVVEVKTNEGCSSEAVINKLTDASLYTVVFDDGDEKTLRRTSLCLKGERHFAESETLDQLPLTNPEHFGTPVIGKKTNRGRRSAQAVADEENESSSSEEEEEERRVSDQLLGKVCSVQGQERSVVLVVSSVCSEELVVKKDHCLVRSFADGKFSTVFWRNLTALSSSWSHTELSDCKGAGDAQAFLRSGLVPEVWKMDLSQILESSSDSDEKHSEEEPENVDELKKKPGNNDSEPEEEPDPEERDNFLQQLYKFMEDRGTSINKPPVLGYKDLNLFKLFRLVTHHGGYGGIESGTVWKQIYMDLGIPILNSAAAYNVKTAYRKYLFGFEHYCRSALITFRTVHHNNPHASLTNQRPASETKTGSPANQRAAPEQKDSQSNQRAAVADPKDSIKMEPETESDSDHDTAEHLTSPRGRRRCVAPLKDDQREPRKRAPRQSDPSDRPPRLPNQPEREGRLTDQLERGGRLTDQPERGGRLTDQPERGGRLTDQPEEGGRLTDQPEGGGRLTDQPERGGRLTDQPERGGRLTDQSERGSEDEDEDEEEGPLLNPAERCDSDPDSDSVAGTRVRVKYGRGKTQKIYEAHIKRTDIDNGENFYLVHYYGWNVRYDEWVKGDRIIWPSEKGSKKKRGKLKNKDEPDGEEERPPKEEPPPKCPGRRGRPLGSKNKTNGRSVERRDPGPAIANGNNTPRRRTRRTSGMFDSDRASNEDSGNSVDDSESEDSLDKKPFPWRLAEDGPPQGLSIKLEEGEEEESKSTSETTLFSQTSAPSMPQETAPSQSQMRTEPGGPPERKDPSPPSSDTPSKLKLPLMALPPRSEPMVLLHHCLPPDSGTDSASESDSEDTDGDAKLHPKGHKSEDRKGNVDNQTEEKCTRSPDKTLTAKSPLRDRNMNLRSPNARSLWVRSPLRDRPLGDKKLGEKSPLRQDKTLEEKCLKSEQIQVSNTPEAERTAKKQNPVPPGHSPKPDQPETETSLKAVRTEPEPIRKPVHTEPEPVRKPVRTEPEPLRKPVRTETEPIRKPVRTEPEPIRKPVRTEPEPFRKPVRTEPEPVQKPVQTEPEPVRKPVQTEPEPIQKPVQTEPGPVQKPVQTEIGASPKPERTEPEPLPNPARTEPEPLLKPDRTEPEPLLKPDRMEPEPLPKPDRTEPDRTEPEPLPKPERTEPETLRKPDQLETETSPTPIRTELQISPKRVQPGTFLTPDRIHLEISPRPSLDAEMISAARSEGNTTPLKRKASEQKSPDKKLKTEPEVSPSVTKAPAEPESSEAEDEEKPLDAGSAKAERSGEGGTELQDVPEMGVDALVCHEVDLDEPDERERVCASEQLMLMRESHLLRAPPTPEKSPPPQTTREQSPKGPQRGAARHEETNGSPTSNGDRGQKRVMEGPHSPTVKKLKRPSHKRLLPQHKPDKNGAGHSSDSEDQTHKQCSSPNSRGHKWTLHIDDLQKMSSSERISFLQEKLQEIRKYYLSLKSEVASIDRRRKRLKKKEREVSNTLSASSSSDTAMSPSSSSPSQSSLAVEVR